jgi:hypothetical protein
VIEYLRILARSLKQLMDTASPAEMRLLMQRFSGLYKFAQILERVVAGIQSGEIPVPK